MAFAALALGLRCIVLAAECDPALRLAKQRFFPNMVEIERVEDLNVEMLRQVVQKRQFSAILVGGGSPCQGNSFLNSRRKGLDDERSWQPGYLRAFADAARHAYPDVPLFCMLENVASAPPSVVAHYTDLMKATPVELDAADWGYVRRRRLYWIAGPRGGVGDCEVQVPDGFDISEKGDRFVIHKSDGKPWPPAVRLESGYRFAFTPSEVASGTAEPMHVFTREFEHPRDRLQAAPLQAQLRFEFDKRRFPPSAYGDESLLWKDQRWRHPTPNERAAIMGVPSTALQQLLPDAPTAERTAALNCAIGNGFHIPSVMLVLFVLFQLSDVVMATSPSPAWSCPAERRLRRLVPGTVFDDTYLSKSKFIQPNLVIVRETFKLFPNISFPTDLHAQMAKYFDKLDLTPLQAFWV